MNVLKVNKSKVEIYKSNGSYVRTIAVGRGNIVFADFNLDQSLVLITYDTGKVEIFKENGSYVRAVGKSDATMARWNGKEIMIQRKNGRAELYKENGSYIRSI